MAGCQENRVTERRGDDRRNATRRSPGGFRQEPDGRRTLPRRALKRRNGRT